jgi:hypothetical protein
MNRTKYELNNPPELSEAFRERIIAQWEGQDITEAQKQSFWRVVKFQGEDKFQRVSNDTLAGCLIVEFAHIYIGIEPDGYAHS